ncbi:MAG: CopG family transcriptional regulator [Anaerolineales bacterium]|nr:CopG family transcriptional regulator [Anaerolineales bacterium]
MSQITIYLDDESESLMRASAQAAGLSVSRWLANLIHEKVSTEWPASVIALAGAWPDLPDPAIMRNTEQSDAPREQF